MSVRADQERAEHILGEEGRPGPSSSSRWSGWNWFGAAFGLTVLIGAGIFYLSARLTPDPQDETVVASPSTVASPAGEVTEEPSAAPAPAPDVDTADAEAVAGRIAALLGLYMADSLETHALAEVYADAATVDASHIAQIRQLLAALDTAEWPGELSELASEFRADLAELLQAMEAGEMEEIRHGIDAVHTGQHSLSSGAFAWLAGAPMPEHEEAEATADATVADAALEVVEVEMFEFGYTPAAIDLEAGVPVILRFTNTGRLPHEAMVGDAHMQEEFAAAGNHEDEAEGDHHGDVMATLVQPGETKDLQVLIEEPGTWYVACHLVGHYEQGQVATIDVRG